MFPCMPSRRHFWRTLQLQWLFLEDVPCFARETCQEEPSKLQWDRRWKQTFAAVQDFWSLEPYSALLAMLRAFSSLKPQAYLIKTYIAYIRQNLQQNLNSWCISKSSGLIVRLAHVAPSSEVAWLRPNIYKTEFQCPYSCLKGHSCKKCLSNYVLDWEQWSTLEDNPSSGMFERTFMWKMFVKLCAGFWPENANTFLSILTFFSNEISLLQHHMGLGMIVDPINARKAKHGA